MEKYTLISSIKVFGSLITTFSNGIYDAVKEFIEKRATVPKKEIIMA